MIKFKIEYECEDHTRITIYFAENKNEAIKSFYTDHTNVYIISIINIGSVCEDCG